MGSRLTLHYMRILPPCGFKIMNFVTLTDTYRGCISILPTPHFVYNHTETVGYFTVEPVSGVGATARCKYGDMLRLSGDY